MKTPVWDFVSSYASSGILRLHMPGHKGHGRLGCEQYDITEIIGADALYEASGIIAESEANTASLFGSRMTLYSTEGSSQCIRAMVHLAVTCRGRAAAPVILAARNAHRSFVYAAALAGADVMWLTPGVESCSLMSCPVDAQALEQALDSLSCIPCGVYVTSPDYLGQCQDIAALSGVCRPRGIPLIVDNAHGAYLHFFSNPMHPLDLGADICCDSAHKLLPVLTGGAYLHISQNAPDAFVNHARLAMALHGSTSPSYLIMASLDLCCDYLDRKIRRALPDAAAAISAARLGLKNRGWHISDSDPLRITIPGDGYAIGARLRSHGIEPEYAARDAAVLLFPIEKTGAAADMLIRALGLNDIPDTDSSGFTGYLPVEHVMSIRDAVFSSSELLPSSQAVGRIAAQPTASCPPAVPVVMPGERITGQAAGILEYYGYNEIYVVKE